ncbi:hypothetical protein TNCV_3993751 [Trichonephila clavipes]|uniref:Uncharacterized protein n=1 Tax=Trichonephila clavipes TaxID=2585209 RepID=A0A8X6T024_TRICX|nr:hypothetical protein TNCV_3993751 [Trichonephila clavipes]
MFTKERHHHPHIQSWRASEEGYVVLLSDNIVSLDLGGDARNNTYKYRVSEGTDDVLRYGSFPVKQLSQFFF